MSKTSENTPKKSSPLTTLVFLFVGLPLAFLAGGLLSYQYFSKEDIPTESTNVTSVTAVPAITPYEINEATEISSVKPPGEKITAIRTLSKGFEFSSELNFQPGKTASEERVSDNSYTAHYNLQISEPSPATSLEEISLSSPYLAEQIKDLPILLEDAKVHKYWDKLYKLKKQKTADHSHHLLKLLTKHNYYDCNTVLNITHPETKRIAMLMQADMDVVADGSDGDRLPSMPDEIVNSTHYQPTTSYSWKKNTETPNPMIEGYKKRIQNADLELNNPGIKTERKNWLKSRKKMLLQSISEMEKRSYLIAEHDPFIVLPVPVIVAKDKFSPNVGDYAIVFYDNMCYPAIVGDAGPDYKVGEASVRLAKQINKNASPYRRPVSDLSVTYLIFPGTRKQPHSAPDYNEIRIQCSKLIEELGGLTDGQTLHQWENTLPSLPPTNLEENLPSLLNQ